MFWGSGHPDTKACPRHAGGFYLHYKTVIFNNGVVALSGHLKCFYYVTAVAYYSVVLGRVALVAQRPIVVKLSRGQSVGPYVRTCVSACKRRSVQRIMEKRRIGSGCRLAS